MEDINSLSEENEEEESGPFYWGSIRLQEREKFSLTVNKYINNFRVFLADGRTLIDWNYENEKNGNKVEYTSPVGNNIFITMDEEIKHGATLQVEYAIEVTNNSRNINCTQFTLIDYLTYSNTGFLYSENMNLLNDNTKTNKDQSWEKVKPEQLETYIANAEDVLKPDATFLKYEYTGNLNPGETKTIYLTTSKVLSKQSDDSNFYNEVELVQYSNSTSRRNYNTSGTPIVARQL